MSPACQHLVSKWKRARSHGYSIRCQCYLHFQCSPCSVPPFTGFCLISAYSDKWGDRWGRRLTHGVTMILQSHSAPFSPNES